MTVSKTLRAIVRRLAPREEMAQILEDLDEESAEIADRDGIAAAKRWQRWQVANSAGPWIARRLSDSGRGISRSTTTATATAGGFMGLVTDIRVSLRRLFNAPGFTALAVATLAVGIGAFSIVFSLAHALWLKPLPYTDPDRLVRIMARHAASNSTASLTAQELAEYGRSGTLSGVAGFSYGASIARVNGEPLRIVTYRVSPNLFDVLGVNPAVGRGFSSDDAKPGSQVLMLSHATWMARFGGDPAVTSRTMTLFGVPYTIAGVMPQGFAFPRGLEAAVWLPTDLAAGTGHDRIVESIARLAPDRTLADAATEIEARARSLAAALPATNADWSAIVVPSGATTTASGKLAYQSLLGLVGLFLAISCANLAGLLLSRNSSRRAEFAVCLSVGASRWRLARAQLVDTVLLAGAGCAAGVALAAYGTRLAVSFMPPRTPGLADVHVNGVVIAAAVIVAIVASALIALGPVLSLRSMKPSEALVSARTAARATGRAQHALVTVEVALAVLLVVGAGVMVRTLTGLIGRDRGYNPKGLHALNVSLPFATDEYRDTSRRAREFNAIIARVSAVEGVRGAAATTGFPGSALGILGGAPVDPPDGAATVMAAIHAASDGYFETMATPITAGRAFTPADSTGTPGVAIVNEELARAFPGGNPIGRRIPLAILGDRPTLFEIVGVARNITLTDRTGPRVFVPLAQVSPYWIDLVFRAETGDRAVQDVRQALRNMSGDLLLENESSFRTIIANSLALERTQSAFAVMIGTLATMVTGIGLYALMTFVVTQRRRELGIRLALGSEPRRLFWDAMAGAMRLVALGLAIGVILTAAVVRALGTRVFGLTAADPAAYVGAALFVLAVSILAVWIPARTVIRTDPLLALRAD